MSPARSATTGLALGVGWGVLARVWMRLISTEPGFSWSGTALLVGGAGVVGLLLGLVRAARARNGSRWWRLVHLVVLTLLAEGGPPLLAAATLGGWAMHRGRLGRAVAAVTVLAAAASITAILWNEVDYGLSPFPDAVYRSVVAVGGLAIVATATWASSVVLAPWDRGRRTAVAPVPAVTVA